MASSVVSPKIRRLRWALVIALALHLALLWRYAPRLYERLETSVDALLTPAKEEIVEIAPLVPPPKGRGMSMSTALGQGSALRPLPPAFFKKPSRRSAARMQLSGDLDFARASGVQIVANIVPSALRLSRPPAPPPATSRAVPATQRPQAAAPGAAQPAVQERPVVEPSQGLALSTEMVSGPLREAVGEPQDEIFADAGEPAPEPYASEPALPFLLPPEPEPAPEPSQAELDAAIAQAASAAAQDARLLQSSAQRQSAQDLRAMLPQAAVVPAPPLPFGGSRAAESSAESGITTYSLGAPSPAERAPAAPEPGRLAAARQQFFGTLTASLKATNVRMLAEAVKAGPKATLRMKFLVDRNGRVSNITTVDNARPWLVERAVAVIRAASLPPIPEAMGAGPVELSFPVEVYQ